MLTTKQARKNKEIQWLIQEAMKAEKKGNKQYQLACEAEVKKIAGWK